MLYVFLSICCSVVVSVLLKLAKRYHIDIFQAITWNYSMAILLTWFFFRPHLTNLNDAPVYNYLALGILFPLLFVIMAVSVRVAGIVRTDVAQRLSLFIPILAAFFLFDESKDLVKIIGIALAFAAIICSVQWQNAARSRVARNSWVYLLAVFLGFGVIDVLLKQITRVSNVPFTAAIFVIFILAFVLCLITLIYQIATKKTKFSWPHILIGWILGVANFGNILFYLKAHQKLADSPSAVFSSMNIGVIIVGTFIGVFIFKERLSTLNQVGIAVAVLAIVVIYFPQVFGFLHF